MKAEPILRELEIVKDRLTDSAGGDVHRFLDQMETWLERHPHAGPVVNSPTELRERVEHRARTEPPPTPRSAYRVHNPLIAEIHRIREQLAQPAASEDMALREQPPKPDGQ